MIRYIFTLKHDKGTVKINHISYCNEHDLQLATKAVLEYEKAPESAIQKIEIKTK